MPRSPTGEPFDFTYLGCTVLAVFEDLSTDELVLLNKAGVLHFVRLSDLDQTSGTKWLIELVEEVEFQNETSRLRADVERKLMFGFNMSRALLDSLTIGVMVTRAPDEGGHPILEFSRELEALLGALPENVGTTTLEEFRDRSPEASLVRDLTDTSPSDLMQKETRTIEISSDEQKFIKRIIAPFTDGRKKVLGSVWMFMDVTAEVVRGYVDPLTGLLNQRYLKTRLSDELKRIERYRGRELSMLAVIMADIDHFKKINDVYGHPEGDRALAAVGRVIQNSIREVDVATRYGGEEFTVILPNTNLEAAVQVAERMRENIEAHAFSSEYRVTASFGVASDGNLENSGTGREAVEDSVVSGTVERLIQAADQALYAAKQNGRNRVMTYPP